MYKVILPLLGFEDYKEIEIDEIDEYFSTIVFEGNKRISIVNINYLNRLHLNFDIDDNILNNLNVSSQKDFDIYFCLVVQSPIDNSIVNLIAPILINQKDRLIGQYVLKHKIPRLFSTLIESTTL